MAKRKSTGVDFDPRARGMKKEQVYPRDEHVDADYDWNEMMQERLETDNGILNGSLEEVLERIVSIPMILGVTGNVHLKYHPWDDGLEVFTERPETDAEYAARMKQLDAKEAAKKKKMEAEKAKELALLAKLEAKYKTTKKKAA